VVYPPRRSFLEILANPLGESAGAFGLPWASGGEPGRALGAAVAPLRLFRRGEPLAIMPHVAVH